MHIHLEGQSTHSIDAYSETEIKIGNSLLKQSFVLASEELNPDWPIQSLEELNESLVKPLIRHHPKIIIIGHEGKLSPLPLPIQKLFLQKHIGVEVMSIGAACRTFNVLLSEKREVSLGIIFNH